jgi:hypothetical protein
VHSKTYRWNNHLTINEIPKWSKVCHQMPIPRVISILTPYVVMFNPLITQIKTKNWFLPFHVLSQQVFSIVTFCWLHLSNLNFTFGCSFKFQILINVIGNYENYTKNEDFYLGDLILHTNIYLDNIPKGY